MLPLFKIFFGIDFNFAYLWYALTPNTSTEIIVDSTVEIFYNKIKIKLHLLEISKK